MNPIFHRIHLGVTVLGAVMLIYLLVETRSDKVIAFVRSPELLGGYHGMTEVRLRFEKENASLRHRLDSLSIAFDQSQRAYISEAGQLDPKTKEARAQSLRELRAGVIQEDAYVKDAAGRREQEMLEGVLNQVNAFVADYAKANGYAIVMGTTTDGNLLYGDEALDITAPLLKAMNLAYDGGEIQ